MSRLKRKWSKKEDAFLKEFFKKLNNYELTQQLNNINIGLKRTQEAVISRAYKLNLKDCKLKRNLVEDRRLVFELIKKGYTIPDINKKTKISISAINKFFEFNYRVNEPPEEIEKKYYENEDDILKEIELSYDSKNLKDWELKTFKKL